ncbi:hypothetical protein N8475_09460 [Winogradskyella sp.]|nr:hypothetical protein [Winogradskyella sp.]
MSNLAVVFGFGFKYKQRYSFGLNYYALKKINDNDLFSNNMSGSYTFNLAYALF